MQGLVIRVLRYNAIANTTPKTKLKLLHKQVKTRQHGTREIRTGVMCTFVTLSLFSSNVFRCLLVGRVELCVIMQVYKLDEDAPVRLVDVLTLQGHDDIVSSVAASRSHDGLVLSGSYDRRYYYSRSSRAFVVSTFCYCSGFPVHALPSLF